MSSVVSMIPYKVSMITCKMSMLHYGKSRVTYTMNMEKKVYKVSLPTR